MRVTIVRNYIFMYTGIWPSDEWWFFKLLSKLEIELILHNIVANLSKIV